MPTNKLTDNHCRAAKPSEKPRKLSDGHGLYLYVTPAGGKIWRMTYRLDGKQQTATLGKYPIVSLAEARTARDATLKRLHQGIDVRAKPRSVPSFKEAATTYWTGRKDVTAGYFANAIRGLEMHLFPHIGATPISGISRDDLLDALKLLDAKGRHVYVRRVRVWASQVFDWALEHGHVTANPATAIKPEKAFGRRPVENHAALTLSEIPAFMQRLSLEDELQSVLACKLMALTWVRTGELRGMRWSEIDGDLWRIPADRMKMKRDHIVPLSIQALGLIAKLRARCRNSDFVFPAEHRTDRTISENAVLYLLWRIGYKDRMTGHGWRGVASTWANEGGYPPDAIERQLAHAPNDAVRSAYNHAAYLPQRRVMLQDWADWLFPDGAIAPLPTIPEVVAAVHSLANPDSGAGGSASSMQKTRVSA